MARRRKRIKTTRSWRPAFLTVLALLQLINATVSQGLSRHHNHHTPRVSSELCGSLPQQVARQLRLCKLTHRSHEASEAVRLGAFRGLNECKHQFKSERWNCTHASGEHELLFGELPHSLGNRESAFLQAIAAAGIVHSIASACSSGNLSDCACDRSRVGVGAKHYEEKWKWGGCSNNIRHGMLFAKHYVELLDALHQRSKLRRRKRAAIERRLMRYPQSNNTLESLCQSAATNQNLSKITHLKLIRSLLAENSLERHQEFRLAMNMHNNRVGRMAVANNMELRCRCHGLSGSCSMKTCWLSLPNFQVIGAYLKKKYDTSVHLPSAVDLNRLIPMMDHDEVSAILGESAAEHQRHLQSQLQLQPFNGYRMSSGTGGNIIGTIRSGGHNQTAHQPQEASQDRPPFEAPLKQREDVENVTPMSQQQYLALLRDMKLCNSTSGGTGNSNSYSNGNSISYTGSGSNGSGSGGSYGATDASIPPATVGGMGGENLEEQQQRLVVGSNHHNKRPTYHISAAQGVVGMGQIKTANQHLAQVLHARNKDDLIHLHKSPDYCRAEPKHGFAGVQARVCNPNPLAPDNCDKLCCGQGYTTRSYQHSYNCDCTFLFCCSIKCNLCPTETKVSVCN